MGPWGFVRNVVCNELTALHICVNKRKVATTAMGMREYYRIPSTGITLMSASGSNGNNFALAAAPLTLVGKCAEGNDHTLRLRGR